MSSSPASSRALTAAADGVVDAGIGIVWVSVVATLIGTGIGTLVIGVGFFILAFTVIGIGCRRRRAPTGGVRLRRPSPGTRSPPDDAARLVAADLSGLARRAPRLLLAIGRPAGDLRAGAADRERLGLPHRRRLPGGRYAVDASTGTGSVTDSLTKDDTSTFVVKASTGTGSIALRQS